MSLPSERGRLVRVLTMRRDMLSERRRYEDDFVRFLTRLDSLPLPVSRPQRVRERVQLSPPISFTIGDQVRVKGTPKHGQVIGFVSRDVLGDFIGDGFRLERVRVCLTEGVERTEIDLFRPQSLERVMRRP